MAGNFRFSRTRFALSTTADALTIVASDSQPLWLMLAEVEGAEAAVANNEVIIAKSTGGTTPGGALTVNGDGTPTFSVYTTWAAQPTIGEERWRSFVQALGGMGRFQALPGGHIRIPAGEQISLRSVLGTSNVTTFFHIYEP